MKEYPIHRASQFAGQVGIWMVWLWTAITMAGASHTAHLDAKRNIALHTQTLHTLPPPFVSLPADEGLDALSGDGGHGHGHGLRRGQPIGVVVAGGEVADVVDVAEHEGHGAEPAQAAASRA